MLPRSLEYLRSQMKPLPDGAKSQLGTIVKVLRVAGGQTQINPTQIVWSMRFPTMVVKTGRNYILSSLVFYVIFCRETETMSSKALSFAADTVRSCFVINLKQNL